MSLGMLMCASMGGLDFLNCIWMLKSDFAESMGFVICVSEVEQGPEY